MSVVMRFDAITSPPSDGSALPAPLDCETAALLRSFLTPLLEEAESWPSLADALAAKGFALGFLEGHLVISRADTGAPLCTGRALGVPLSDLSRRLGRPAIRAHADGHTGDLI